MEVNYNDWKRSFNIDLDEETYRRVEISKWPWRRDFNLLVRWVKTNITEIINTYYITLK